MNLEVVSYDRDHHSEASVKVSSRSNIRNLSRLHLSSKSLPGVLGDIEVPDEPGGGVMCQDSTCPTSLSLESTKIPVPRMKYHH